MWQKGLGLVLLLGVEYLAEVKTRQRHRWEARNDCPRKATQEVGVDQTTILGCFEENRASLSTQRKAPPLWDLQSAFAQGGDDEDQMVGQGLCWRVESTLERRTDYTRGKECFLDDESRP